MMIAAAILIGLVATVGMTMLIDSRAELERARKRLLELREEAAQEAALQAALDAEDKKP